MGLGLWPHRVQNDTWLQLAELLFWTFWKTHLNVFFSMRPKPSAAGLVLLVAEVSSSSAAASEGIQSQSDASLILLDNKWKHLVGRKLRHTLRKALFLQHGERGIRLICPSSSSSSILLQPFDWSVSMLEKGQRLWVSRSDLDRCLPASVGHGDPARGSPVWKRVPLRVKGHPAAASPPRWLRLVSTPPQHIHASLAEWALASFRRCPAGGEEDQTNCKET